MLALISMYCPAVDAVWPAVSWPVSQSGNRPVTEKQQQVINCQSMSVSKHRRGLKRPRLRKTKCMCVCVCVQLSSVIQDRHTRTDTRLLHTYTHKLETIVMHMKRKCQTAWLCLDSRLKLKWHVSRNTAGELHPSPCQQSVDHS